MNRQGLGIDYFVSLTISTDSLNSSLRTLSVDQPQLGMSREYLVNGFDDKKVQHYFKTAALLGSTDAERAHAELKEALLLEIELARASASREEKMEALSSHARQYTIEQFPAWVGYVNQILLDVGPREPFERVYVEDPGYVEGASELLNRTQRRVIANYLGWRLTQSFMSYMDASARSLQDKFDKSSFGVNAASPRWQTCVEEVGFNTGTDASFRIPAASLYVARYFPPEAKHKMLHMVEYLRGAFLKILEGSDWMDPLTKERAKEKLKAMREFIGYPDELLDRAKVEAYHEGIEIKDDDFLGNVIRLQLWDRKLKFGRLDAPIDKQSWLDHSLVALVNAFYSFDENSIVFPAGMLQGAFFHHQVPMYLNFGAIGSVIGHEITHGFDDSGRQFDLMGNLLEWWEKETSVRFLEKTRCMVEQYGNFSSSQVGMHVNGIITLGENIADNGGIKEAFMAY
ncbi:unnamed protein product, partial [Sphagnum tenellum]